VQQDVEQILEKTDRTRAYHQSQPVRKSTGDNNNHRGFYLWYKELTYAPFKKKIMVFELMCDSK